MKTEVTVTNAAVYTHYNIYGYGGIHVQAFVKEPHSKFSIIRYDEQPIFKNAEAKPFATAFDSILNQPLKGSIHINITTLKDIVDHLHATTGGQGIFRLDTFEHQTSNELAIGLRFTECDTNEPIAAALMPVKMPEHTEAATTR